MAYLMLAAPTMMRIPLILLEKRFRRLFFKIIESTRRVYVWIHVDDTLIAVAEHLLGVNITTFWKMDHTQTELLNAIFTELEEYLPKSNKRHLVRLKPNRQPTKSEPFDRKQEVCRR